MLTFLPTSHLGHSGSAHWTMNDSEKADIFRKIEPYLTFLNTPQLERQGADMQSKVLNQSLRNRGQAER